MKEILIHEDEKLKIYSITESVSLYPDILSSFSSVFLFIPIYITDKEKNKTFEANLHFEVLLFDSEVLVEIDVKYYDVYEILKNYYEFTSKYDKQTYYFGYRDDIESIKTIKEPPLSLIETFVLDQILELIEMQPDFTSTLYKFHDPLLIRVESMETEQSFEIPIKKIIYLNNRSRRFYAMDIGNINYRILNPNREAKQIDVEDTFDIMLNSITFIFDKKNLCKKFYYHEDITDEFEPSVVIKFGLYRIEKLHVKSKEDFVFDDYPFFATLNEIICVPDIKNEKILETLIRKLLEKENKRLKEYLILDALKIYKDYVM